MSKKIEISIKQIETIDFTKYGQVIRIPAPHEAKPDLKSDIINFYGALGMFNSHDTIEFGICTFNKRDLVFEQLEQHILTQELLYAVDDDFIIPVAPNLIKSSGNLPDLDNLLAVRIRRGQGVIFHRCTWHWVPFPYKEESFALVGFIKDTSKNDLEIIDLDTKVRIKE